MRTGNIPMTKYWRAGAILPVAVALAVLLCVFPADAALELHYMLSMERPNMHYFHVELRCEGLPSDSHEFRMPTWTPGYYRIMDYSRNVVNFRAVDGNGRPLRFEKTAKNAWKVVSGKASVVIVGYDVYAFNRFVADSYLGDDCAFVTPAGVFMYVHGMLGNPVTVEIRPLDGWSHVATGLDPVNEKPGTFYAADFDTLYDCPILAGNLEILEFEVLGLPHRITAVDLGDMDRVKFAGDLKRMAEAAVSVIGHIPYRHYTFLIIGPGGGGLEHLNSCALTLNPARLKTPAGYKSWLAFVAHEFFHLYNVKAIRPVALGPFEYDRENYTRMLWVSEGLTVYYEYLILNRAGLMTRREALNSLGSVISRYERSPGRRIQPATASSFDTWLHFFSRGEHAINSTVSYYNAGAVLGLLLDLKIRHETGSRASLDDVMKYLYQEFYQKKKRGFTDEEFRRVCENTAGAGLKEIFEDYAEAAAEIDYAKYLSYAGLELEDERGGVPSATLGARIEDRNGVPVISGIEWNSPAAGAGLSAGDEIISLDGVRVTARAFNEILSARKPGERIRVSFFRRNKINEVEVILGAKVEKNYRLKPVADPSTAQRAVLGSWLK